jgi:hypothetical protein
MFTDPTHSLSTTPDEQYVVPRVIKIPLPYDEIRQFVEDSLEITDPSAQKMKIFELELSQFRNQAYIGTTYVDDSPSSPFRDLRDIFGWPQFIVSGLTYTTTAKRRNVHTARNSFAWTQDYCQPIFSLMEKLDYDNPQHDHLMRMLIGRYALMQPELIKQEFFDPTFKFTNGYGAKEDGRLQVNDFAEFIDNPEEAEQLIRNKEWEQLVDRVEYPKLPSHLQDYLNEMMEKHLTLNTLKQWGARSTKIKEGLVTVASIGFETTVDWDAIADGHRRNTATGLVTGSR